MPAPVELTDEERELADAIAEGIDQKLRSLGFGVPRAVKDNVSFVISCRRRIRERKWDKRRQRRVCAALERRYLEAGWRDASVYVMEHDHLRLRVTLRSDPPSRAPAAGESRPA